MSDSTSVKLKEKRKRNKNTNARTAIKKIEFTFIATTIERICFRSQATATNKQTKGTRRATQNQLQLLFGNLKVSVLFRDLF